jgi:hypothetical protein
MSQLRQRISLVGVLFAAFMMVALTLDNTPDSSKTAKWAAYYSHHGNQVRAVVSAYLWVAAGLSLLGFLLVLRDRMGGRMPLYTLIAGTFSAAAMGITGAIWGSVGGTVLFGDAKPPSGELANFLTSTAYPVLVLSAMLPLAVCLLSLGVVAIRTHALPIWIGWFAAVTGVVLFASFIWIPMLVAVLFGLVVGIALAVRVPAPAPMAAPAPV